MAKSPQVSQDSVMRVVALLQELLGLTSERMQVRDAGTNPWSCRTWWWGKLALLCRHARRSAFTANLVGASSPPFLRSTRNLSLYISQP
jgi:hypothetical protein